MKHFFTFLLTMLMVLPTTAATAVNHAAQATKSVDLTDQDYSHKVLEDGGETFWAFTCRDVTKDYYVKLYYGHSADDQYGHFEYDDLQVYSNIQFYSQSVYQGFAEIVEGTTLDITLSAEGLMTLTAVMVCNDGNTYNVSGTWEKYIPSDIEVEATTFYHEQSSYDPRYEDWTVVFGNDDYTITLDVVSKDAVWAGHYGTLAMDSYFSKVYNHKTQSVVKLTTLDAVFVGESEPGDIPLSFEITGTAKSEKGDTYFFHYNCIYIEPKEQKNIDVQADSFEWPSTHIKGSLFHFRDNDSRDWTVAVNGLVGEFDTPNLYPQLTCYKESNGRTVHLNNGEVTMTYNADTHLLNVACALVMYDSIQYNFNADFAPYIAYEQTINYDNLLINSSWVEARGLYYFEASNSATVLKGQFGAEIYSEDLDPETVALTLTHTAAQKQVNPLLITSARWYDEGNQLDLRFLGDDMVDYKVHAAYNRPQVKDTIDVHVPNAQFINYVEDIGVLQMMGYNREANAFVTVAVHATQLAGHYTFADMAGLERSNALLLQPDTEYEELFYLVDANLDVTTSQDIDGNFVCTLAGTVQAGEYWVNLSMVYNAGPDGDEYDMKQDVEAAFTQEDVADWGLVPANNTLYIDCVNHDGEVFSILLFLYEEGLLADTYTINDTGDPGTVQSGVVTLTGIMPTIYGTLESDGYLNVPVFLCVDGTVEVSYTESGNIHMELEALNTWLHTAHITLDCKLPVGLEQTTRPAPATKVLRDGHLLIELNGRTYNATGAAL